MRGTDGGDRLDLECGRFQMRNEEPGVEAAHRVTNQVDLPAWIGLLDLLAQHLGPLLDPGRGRHTPDQNLNPNCLERLLDPDPVREPQRRDPGRPEVVEPEQSVAEHERVLWRGVTLLHDREYVHVRVVDGIFVFLVEHVLGVLLVLVRRRRRRELAVVRGAPADTVARAGRPERVGREQRGEHRTWAVQRRLRVGKWPGREDRRGQERGRTRYRDGPGGSVKREAVVFYSRRELVCIAVGPFGREKVVIVGAEGRWPGPSYGWAVGRARAGGGGGDGEIERVEISVEELRLELVGLGMV